MSREEDLNRLREVSCCDECEQYVVGVIPPADCGECGGPATRFAVDHPKCDKCLSIIVQAALKLPPVEETE